MQVKNYFRYISVLCALILLSGCSATKRLLEKDQSLLIANTVQLKNSGKLITEKNTLKSELGKQVVYSQQPNKKFLSLFRMKLGIYTFSTFKNKKRLTKKIELENKISNGTATDDEKKELDKLLKKKKFENFLNETSGGEPPVLFDSTTMKTTVNRMKNYLFYHGFFNSDVTYSFQTKNKKTKAIYTASLGNQYTLKEIKITSEDSNITPIIQKSKKELLMRKGDAFDIDVIKKDRTLLAEAVQNEGYFVFSPEYISMNVDSTIGNKEVNVELYVNLDVDSSIHKKYYYDEITINVLDYEKKDKILNQTKRDYIYDTICDVAYKTDKKTVFPRALSKSIYIHKDDLYSKNSMDKTKNALNNLGIFKYVNVEYDPYSFSPDEIYLITRINCSPAKRHSFNLDNELNTNAKSTLGFAITGGYTNKNLFKSAAKFQLNFSAGVEFQLLKENRIENSPISTININSEAKIDLARIFPTFKVRSACDKTYKYKPRTFIALNYSFQRRIGLYDIHTVGLNYGYEFYNNKFRHSFSPLSFTYVNPTKITEKFDTTYLTNNARLAQSFQKQFIIGQDYTFSYNNQNLNVGRYKNYFYFRGNAFFSGNIVSLFSMLIKKDEAKPRKVGGIPFSQFFRLELEPRYSFNFKRGQTVALRMFVGAGIPYGNSTYSTTEKDDNDSVYIREVAVLPYVRQFFSGGPNSLRGWQFRKVGPGGYNIYNTLKNDLDQTADLKFEFNAEYRFNIYKFFNGALFTDIGNIWLLKEDPNKPYANFAASRFMKELAWDAGAGVRMDFNFFVLRFDVGFVLYDPSFDAGDRWVFNKIDNPDYQLNTTRKFGRGRNAEKIQGLYNFKFKDFVGLNFAIGYPF